jgi:Cu+-exporting ATPase
MSETQTVLSIEGMHCASCTGRVERALLADPSVLTAFVNLSTNRATVRHIDEPSIAVRLAEVISQAGFTVSSEITNQSERREEEATSLRRDLFTAAALSIPVVILAMGPHIVPAFHDVLLNTIGHRTNLVIQLILTTLVLAGPGRRFFTTGLPALLRRAPEMNSLVAIGTGAAWAYSTLVVFAPFLFPVNHRGVYFEAAAVVITLILLGRYLEARAKGRTGAAIQSLLELQPDVALVERDGETIEVAFSDIAEGDILLIQPGARIPVDGPVISGQSFVDESMISGEPIPVEKAQSSALVAGTLNGAGAMRMLARAVGSETTLSKIVTMVEDAQGTKLPIQALVDKVTYVFVPVVLVIACLTVVLWLLSGGTPGQALVAGVSVLIIACPCAMGLATPTSVIVGSGRAAQDGVLFRKGDALQKLQDAKVIAFDKTGTLTKGAPSLTTLDTDGDPTETLRLVASIEQFSEHPIAKAIVAGAKDKGLGLSKPENFVSDTGFGVSGVVDGKSVRVGTARYLNLPEPDRMQAIAAEGQTAFLAEIDGTLAAIIGVSDPVKETAQQTIAALKQAGKHVAMITGDSEMTANIVASKLGIDTVVAGVLPGGKTDAIKSLQNQFGPVAFVGDGINDAPALATADTGIAIGTGTDIAIEAADVVLMSGELNAVSRAFEISQATMGNIRQNLFWAFIYNAALIPVAAGILYPTFGITLSPILASAAMGLSSVFVVSNALRLHRA